MLLPNQVREFFEKNSIPLESDIKTSLEQTSELFMKAFNNCGNSFAGFIMQAVINPAKDGIWTKFNSWEDLYESYCAFMTGFMMYQNKPNN